MLGGSIAIVPVLIFLALVFMVSWWMYRHRSIPLVPVVIVVALVFALTWWMIG
jgi:hypothetical protein